jgi:large subunit ribosomal protein L10
VNRDQKAATIDALAGELKEAETIIAVDYRGLSVSAAAELRTKLRQADASFRVVKNSLTERAAAQAGVDGLAALLEGPTALTFVRGDAALAAKTLAEQARATHLLPFKGAVMGTHELAPEQLSALARLPAREVLYGQLVGVVASPVNGLVRTLHALISGLAVALGQVHEQKEREAPAAEAPAAVEPATAEPATAEDSAEEKPAAGAKREGEEAPAAEEPPAAEEQPTADEQPEAPESAAASAEPEPAPPEVVATEQVADASGIENGHDANQEDAQEAQREGADAEASETKEN